MNLILLLSIVVTALCAAGLLVGLYMIMPSRHARRIMAVTRTPAALDVLAEERTSLTQRALAIRAFDPHPSEICRTTRNCASA